MIAWSSTTLDNLDIQTEAAKAHRQHCISNETLETIRQAHPVNLYTPNPVIRIGLFILTLICVNFSVGFVLLTTGINNENALRGGVVFCGLVCYGILEFAVREKKCYNSGINEALLWMATSLLSTGILFDFNSTTPSATTIAMVMLLLTTLATLRFADMVSAAGVYISLLALIFLQVLKWGNTGKMIMPFVIMGVSLAIYLIVTQGIKRHAFRHYRNSLTLLRILSLITLYLAGNYYVVRETSNTMFDLQLPPGQGIPGGWIFWILTVIIPLLYFYSGIRKKDAVLLRTGLILVSMVVFTVRCYHHLAPVEIAMVLAGIMLTGGAWALIKYLHTPKYGFTYKEADEASMADSMKIESLIIAQTFTPDQTQPPQNNFGGGSGGGGGASGEF